MSPKLRRPRRSLEVARSPARSAPAPSPTCGVVRSSRQFCCRPAVAHRDVDYTPRDRVVRRAVSDHLRPRLRLLQAAGSGGGLDPERADDPGRGQQRRQEPHQPGPGAAVLVAAAAE